MESIVRVGGSNVDRSGDLRGLTTDIKPTAANGYEVAHGTTWLNMDDGSCFMYNKNNDTWYEI